MKQFFLDNKNNVWFWAFTVIVFALLFIMPMMSKQAGNTGDEDGFQIPQGKNVVNYYKTNGQDTTCMNFKDNLQFYGSSFDVITEYINQTFKIEDISKSRHVCNSLMGWLAVLMVGLIAYQFGGARAGVFALILMFLSPRFLGHSFNNPKDVPFLAGIASSIFGMVLFFKQFPKVKWYSYVILILSIALAISVRIGGLVLFGYFGLLGFVFLIQYVIRYSKLPKEKNQTKNMTPAKAIMLMLVMGVAICVVGFFVGILIWPYAMQSPIKHSIESFNAMSSFATSLRQLFEGSLQWSDYLPWYYTPKYILITIPIAVIIGMVLFFIFCWRKKEDRFWAFFVFFTFFFPVFWIVYTHANVYGGWRHAMFAYPTMVVAAGWGFDGLLRWVENKFGILNSEKKSAKGIVVNVAGAAVVLLLLAGPIRHIIVNHPYEYVYFNELAGGTKNALGNYELDYYYHSTREASEWIIANAEKKADGSKVRVGTWHTASVNYFFRKDTADFQPVFIRWYEKENTDWDYAIFTVTGIYPKYLKSKNFPPKNTIKTIDVDGVPICFILKREDKSDYKGFKYKEQNQLDSAILMYQKALQVDPNNMGALCGLGEIYVRKNNPDSAQLYLNPYLKIDPEAEIANLMLAYSYAGKGDLEGAMNTLHSIMKRNPKYMGAHILAIQICLQQKDIPAAKREFDKVIEVDRVDEQVTSLWIQYEAMQNIDQQTAYTNLYKAMIRSLEKRGKKKEANKLREQSGIK
ncbi:MAG: tetratricopeptide repeat protein [Bacteroidales bacterium]|nr:tetratricopeptide repeat protein [Bacteroidales bacterium]